MSFANKLEITDCYDSSSYVRLISLKGKRSFKFFLVPTGKVECNQNSVQTTSSDRQVETKIALQNIINILVKCFYLQYIFHDNTRRVLSPSSNHRTCIPGAICEAFIQLHK
ncbi:Hypothetical_protein [Hexamita inflata]|uniref:Hypothetical_protein n=1 Tax=Hexamita inflata TaxID=28002 RepID=A0AA86PET0_9EUKA|nr:Hypothetical protein HINF_LOCUS23708 [Hexamita inflata]